MSLKRCELFCTRHRPKRRLGLLLVLCLLALRVAVPVGYMPAPLATGWPVQLCPQGLSADAMVALLGPDHRHHGVPVRSATPAASAALHHSAHHHHAGHSAGVEGLTSHPPSAAEADLTEARADSEHCPLGAFATVLLPAASDLSVEPMFNTAARWLLYVPSAAHESRYLQPQSRAPPPTASFS